MLATSKFEMGVGFLKGRLDRGEETLENMAASRVAEYQQWSEQQVEDREALDNVLVVISR